MSDFLIEIGTEELPPTSLSALSDAFSQNIRESLKSKELNFSEFKSFASPRRLAVLIKNLDEKTPQKTNKVWGPPAKVAFDSDGKPTKAAEAFAKKNNIVVAELQQENDGKVDKLLFMQQAGGEASETLIGNFVRNALNKLPIAKRMRWGTSREEFVRPVQWIVLLKDSQVINETIMGFNSGNTSQGHRFHCNDHLTISTAHEYERILETQGYVIADFAKRKEIIRKQVLEVAKNLGGTPVIEDDLLDEVTGLVELPIALAGKFDEEFLDVPAEALISSMKEHQKYFHLTDNNGNLLPNFITISNIRSKDPSQIVDGNERVIRPRLADAAFFFNTDKKTSLASKAEKLSTVVFQAKLGSIFDKTQRIQKLSQHICSTLGLSNTTVSRASELAKADLVSNMVYEFPEMQGIAGYHYALHDGETKDVADAILEHYKPRFAGDSLAKSKAGNILALADRIDTIVGIFGIGQIPSGSKDPFALRRSSLGALRIIVENKFDLDLHDILSFSANLFNNLPKAKSVVNDVQNYMLERFRSWYEEASIKPEVFQSVNARKLSKPLDINERVYAVAEFAKREEAISLAAANKRVANILAKLDGPTPNTFDRGLMSETAEKDLAETLTVIEKKVEPFFIQNNYSKVLNELAALKKPVDLFFDQVMVMSDDLKIRNNRLALLQNLRSLFLKIADISYLDVKK